MFFLKKLVVAFVRPPGVFVILAVSLALVLALRKRWRPALWAALAGLALWLPAIAPVSDVLRRGLIEGIPGTGSPLTGDVIVVLGGGVDDRAADPFGAMGVLPAQSTRRIVTAVRLYGRLGVPVMVTGGAPLGERVTEAAVAARYLADLGVPREAIVIEDRARDTAENARFVRDLCREKGFGRVLLVTDTHHLKRAALAFAATGLDVRPVGETGMDAGERTWRWHDFLPVSYEDTGRYLHEYLGIMAYRLAR